MGNAASTSGRVTVPSSPAPDVSASTHKSLRTKKKSLELPDLASLAISQSSFRPPPPPPSAPIPIPTSSVPLHERHDMDSHDDSATDLLAAAEASTHIPLFISNRPRSQSSTPPATIPESPFVPEIVRSTIPIALTKHLAQASGHDSDIQSRKVQTVPVKITWTGDGRNVLLIRAGDDSWKAKTPMDRESGHTWSTWVNLAPGTHHVKFIVDDQIRIADDLPRAVDDEGSLANYVAVPLSPHASPHSVSPPGNLSRLRQHSFWSETPSSSSVSNEGKWTSELPPELLAAAREEEAYLASLSQANEFQPAPNIPPAPALPRHLSHLILNDRPSSSDRDSHRNRRRSNNRVGSEISPENSRNPSPTSSGSEVVIPVTTASGTDVTAAARQTHPHATRSTAIMFSQNLNLRRSDATSKFTDDASVLPVPSHVVLHHLTTSAIKNGVLAVADTHRYRQKFITSIYYKPT